MRPHHVLAFCIIWLCALPASATAIIDDSATLPYNAALAMHWQQAKPTGAAATQMVGTVVLQVKLNVAQWRRRAGHIYLVLPAQQPGAMLASWTTQGRLLAGQVRSGGRTLVYAGPISGPFIEDVMQLTITVDGRRMLSSYPVNFRFEMDEE
jgi:hypothetical protein